MSDVAEARWDGRTGAVARKAAVTFLDQVTLSAVSFAVGIAFIYRGTPEQYGLYSFYLSLFFLLASAQNAVVNTPLMVLAPRMAGAEQAAFRRGILGVLGLGIAGTLTAVALAAAVPNAGASFTANLVFALCFLPLMLRDFFRADEFARLMPGLALRRDVVYAALACAGVLLLAMAGSVRALTAFITFGAAAAAVVARPCTRFLRAPPAWQEVAAAFRRSWIHSRWSLVGAGSSWIQSNAYVYVPFLLAGAREVAFLAAARLVMAPAALLAHSWSNVFRPVASRHLSRQDAAGAVQLFLRSTAALVALLGLYAAAALGAFRLLPAGWIPADYRGIDAHLLLWAGVLLVQIVRGNASSVLQASLAFRHLALWGAAVAAFAVAATVLLVLRFGAIGSLAALIAGEVLLMTGLLFQMRRTLAPRPSPTPAGAD